VFTFDRRDVEQALKNAKAEPMMRPDTIPTVDAIRQIFLETPVPPDCFRASATSRLAPKRPEARPSGDIFAELRQASGATAEPRGPIKAESRRVYRPETYNDYDMYAAGPAPQRYNGGSDDESE